MTQDEIIEMARQVGFPIRHPEWQKAVEEFAALVEEKATAKEREACAKVCDELVNKENSGDYQDAANWCSIRIRARGQA
jgi:hypothetical protein